MSAGAQPPVPFIGLTGGMGAGKSTALAALGRLGCATVSADEIVHDLYAGSERLRSELTDRWGEDVAPSGVVDRQAVARRAFASEPDRRWLEQLIWPLVGEQIWQFRRQAEQRQPRPEAVVVETPLLFEAGMESIYDATIAVITGDAERRARAQHRGHAASDERDARQLSQQEKAARATYVVCNDGTVQELEAALRAVLAEVAAGR